MGLLWTIHRTEQASALAVGCDDTIDELAKIIGLSASEFRKWLTPADGFPLPVSSSVKMGFRKFTIPNTIYAYWGGNIRGVGRWAVNWNPSISYLRELGFHVLEKGIRAGIGTVWILT